LCRDDELFFLSLERLDLDLDRDREGLLDTERSLLRDLRLFRRSLDSERDRDRR